MGSGRIFSWVWSLSTASAGPASTPQGSSADPWSRNSSASSRGSASPGSAPEWPAAGTPSAEPRLALIAAGVGPGDIVVAVPLTFMATTEAISRAGARPGFVDSDELTFSMDAEKLQDPAGDRLADTILDRTAWSASGDGYDLYLVRVAERERLQKDVGPLVLEYEIIKSVAIVASLMASPIYLVVLTGHPPRKRTA